MAKIIVPVEPETYYDTGLRLRGFEVWGLTPGRYLYFTKLFIRVPGKFPIEPRQRDDGSWDLGFWRPDGQWHVCYLPYKSRQEAEQMLASLDSKSAPLQSQFTVGYKLGDKFAGPERGGRPWGVTWGEPERTYPPLCFGELAEEEAAEILAFREEVDSRWREANAAWIEEEARRTEAAARAAALDDLPDLPMATECWECGAQYDRPGYVEPGQMGCDRCNDRGTDWINHLME